MTLLLVDSTVVLYHFVIPLKAIVAFAVAGWVRAAKCLRTGLVGQHMAIEITTPSEACVASVMRAVMTASRGAVRHGRERSSSRRRLAQTLESADGRVVWKTCVVNIRH